MCFYFHQTKKATELEHRFKAKIQDTKTFMTSDYYMAFTFPFTPVITKEKPKLIQQYQWGLIPSWAKDKTIRQNTINARIESLTEKPSFKNILNHRCLILADGFYEWQWLTKSGRKKQKYKITKPDNEPFAFAGLYSNWVNQSTGELFNTYTIITTEANALMSEIHNSKKRMPVILKSEDEENWLSLKNISDFKYPYSVELSATKSV